MLVNPNNPNAVSDTKDVEAAARALRLQTHVVTARTKRDFDTAFAILVEQRDCLSPPTCFLSPRAIGLLNWQPATDCPLFMTGASSFPLAV